MIRNDSVNKRLDKVMVVVFVCFLSVGTILLFVIDVFELELHITIAEHETIRGLVGTLLGVACGIGITMYYVDHLLDKEAKKINERQNTENVKYE